MASAAAKLRQLLTKSNEIIVCPGVYDGLTARMALRAGFDALYMVQDELKSCHRISEPANFKRLVPAQLLPYLGCQTWE